MNFPPSLPSRSYRLRLADGATWRLSATDECGTWLERLAEIMELEVCTPKNRLNGASELMFCGSGRAEHSDWGLRGFKGLPCRPSTQGLNPAWLCVEQNTTRIWYSESLAQVVCELTINEGETLQILNMWFSLLPVYQRSMGAGGLPLHAALLERNGRGILLAAPGDGGKSTCCRRLPRDWRPLCDDETLVVLQRQQSYRAHPFPTWSDHLLKRSNKTWDVQHSVPLAAIFFFEQSDSDQVEPLGEGRAAVVMTESATEVCGKFWRDTDQKETKRFRRHLFDNACDMVKKIPAYRLHVSLQGKFWEKIEQVLG